MNVLYTAIAALSLAWEWSVKFVRTHPAESQTVAVILFPSVVLPIWGSLVLYRYAQGRYADARA